MKTCQFCAQRIISSHQSIMNKKCFTRKLFLKISQYSQENTFVGISFLIKKRLEKFLRTLILKNICKRLLLRVSLELFSIWTNNIGSEVDVFSKIKQNKNRSKTQLYEKTCLFMMFFIISFFSLSPLHVRRHLSCIIKDNTSESFETA